MFNVKTKKNFFVFFIIITLAVSFRPAKAQSDEVRIANEYYNSGEFEKAKLSYEKLVKREDNLLLIYNNYLNTLLQLKQKDDALKLTKKMVKFYPEDVSYKIDRYFVNVEIVGEEKAEKEFQSFVNEIKSQSEKVDRAGGILLRKNKTEKAKELYLAARKASGEKTMYAVALANVYNAEGEKDKMIDELLNLVESNPALLEHVKNNLQNNLSDKADFDLLETNLYNRIQKNADQISFNELLLWLNIQHKNFNKAFIQAKAIDKRNKMQGLKLIEVGRIAIENQDYVAAQKYFQYVIDEYKTGFNYSTARKMLITAKEDEVKNTFPIDYNKINSLISDYKILIRELGVNPITLDAMRNLALLYAFYKDQKDTAIVILNDAISQAKYDTKFKDRAKIDLGDIYLLKGEPWESTLLYSQVEKSQKEDILGHEAKLRNAKLAYYKGDFELAQAHLDVLKLATTREISNDAMDLSIMIQDNIGLDTSEDAMREYAAIDLLLFQNKTTEALDSCDKMLKKYPNHSLTDEIYWLKAKLYKRIGNFPEALKMLEVITTRYSTDILGDDAMYMQGIIYEENIKDNEKAKAIFQQLLTKYPGSIFAADARKRFRYLRGDKL